MTSMHPWALVGPAYSWNPGSPPDPKVGRLSRPIIQKYETADFVNAFLKSPRHSLVYNDDDFVYQVNDPGPPGPTAFLERLKLTQLQYLKTEVRKLFLCNHKRFYLVVCELHCDIAGFPSADRNEVCLAGGVVRRRGISVPEEAKAAGLSFLTGMNRAKAQLAMSEQVGGGTHAGIKLNLTQALIQNGQSTSNKKHRELALQKLETERANLKAWAIDSNLEFTLQGWVPSKVEHLGAWADVEEEPQALTEAYFPMYPLVPDPAIKDHVAQGRTLYFGVVPTGSSETDDAGAARFDDRSLYEIRCFVRHHDPRCPKDNSGNDCHGPLVWSAPTEAYQLAHFFDLVGNAQRPVTIPMPDLKALEAQSNLPPSKVASMKLVPTGPSNLEISVDGNQKVSAAGVSAAVCSYSIPLVTIVATLVFNIFLPIVTLLFGLSFMLKLKFCIPPAVGFDASFALQLKTALDLDTQASPPKDPDADATLAAIGLPGPPPLNLSDSVKQVLGSLPKVRPFPDNGGPLVDLRPGQLAQFAHDLADNPGTPSLSENLVYVDEVEVTA